MSARITGLALVLALSIAEGPVFAAADVIEIDGRGDVKIYDRPTIFFVDGSAAAIQAAGPSISTFEHAFPQELISAAAGEQLSPALIEAVAWHESRLRPRVVSHAGAIGEMQLMPETARALGVNPYDTAQNYRGGTKYLAQMMRRYDGDLVRALAAYNAGPGAVDKYGGIPPFRETQAYVAAILGRLSEHAAH